MKRGPVTRSLVVFVFENQIMSIVGLDIKTGYFFYELFFYSTYTSVGVLIPFLTETGQPLDIQLSSSNRIQSMKSSSRSTAEKSPKMSNGADKRENGGHARSSRDNPEIDPIDFYTNSIGNIHPRGKLFIIVPTSKYLIVCNELHEFQCIAITNALVQLSMHMSIGAKARVVSMVNHSPCDKLLMKMAQMFIVSGFCFCLFWGNWQVNNWIEEIFKIKRISVILLELILDRFEKKFYCAKVKKFLGMAIKFIQEMNDHYQRESLLKALAANPILVKFFKKDLNIQLKS